MHDARAYIFIDESGMTTDLLRRYGRSPRGVCVRDYTPYGHWQTHRRRRLTGRRARGASRLRRADRQPHVPLVVPTVTFRLLFVLVTLAHDR